MAEMEDMGECDEYQISFGDLPLELQLKAILSSNLSWKDVGMFACVSRVNKSRFAPFSRIVHSICANFLVNVDLIVVRHVVITVLREEESFVTPSVWSSQGPSPRFVEALNAGVLDQVGPLLFTPISVLHNFAFLSLQQCKSVVDIIQRHGFVRSHYDDVSPVERATPMLQRNLGRSASSAQGAPGKLEDGYCALAGLRSDALTLVSRPPGHADRADA